MTNKNDPQLDDAQLSSIYKQAEQDMPPAHLDETILNAAKQPIKARPINPFSNNWRVSASLAAVLIISVGIVTLMETEVSPVNDFAPVLESSAPVEQQPIASIYDDIQAETIQPTLRKKPQKKPARSTPLTAEVAAMKTEKSRIQQDSVAKQKSKEHKRQLAQTMKNNTAITLSSTMPRLMSAPADIPNIHSISTLRIAGNKKLANKLANKFIRYYFGNELSKADPEKVKLSTQDWKAIIIELRKLDRESIAIKLEKLLAKRLEN